MGSVRVTFRGVHAMALTTGVTVWSRELDLIQTSEDCRGNRFRLIGTSDRNRNDTGFLNCEIVPPNEKGIAYEDHLLQ